MGAPPVHPDPPEDGRPPRWGLPTKGAKRGGRHDRSRDPNDAPTRPHRALRIGDPGPDQRDPRTHEVGDAGRRPLRDRPRVRRQAHPPPARRPEADADFPPDPAPRGGDHRPRRRPPRGPGHLPPLLAGRRGEGRGRRHLLHEGVPVPLPPGSRHLHRQARPQGLLGPPQGGPGQGPGAFGGPGLHGQEERGLLGDRRRRGEGGAHRPRRLLEHRPQDRLQAGRRHGGHLDPRRQRHLHPGRGGLAGTLRQGGPPRPREGRWLERGRGAQAPTRPAPSTSTPRRRPRWTRPAPTATASSS